jgi:hypothetical protein
MLDALVPMAALLTNNSAAKVKAEPDCTVNTTAAHANDLTQAASDLDPFVVDGITRP